ncbi:hypothetical protein PVAND_017412 [Polypedilum vanderplanki]|uniref:Uncharacterized protein n=1 Tax=Polypedilum vanderplanki TaxID=319348 RepID=A0A9J6BI70_POLVA|nr:hypothetical protein PVAND_017412 [Polypedilum vanderplanki]
MLFEFMTSDMRKPLPASIDDLKGNELHSSNDRFFLQSIFVERMKKILNNRKRSSGVVLNGDNILKVHLNDVINKLVPSGIIQYLYDLWHLVFFRRLFIEEEDSRRILSMTDLNWFCLWAFILVIANHLFMVEISIVFYKKSKRQLKNSNCMQQ